MAADKTIKALINHMEDSIGSFQKGIPSIQQGLVDSLVDELRGLQTQQGKILNSVQNLKLIGNIKNKLERLIISEGYKDSVKDFVKAYDAVESLQLQYFAAFAQKFKPKEVLGIIKRQAVDKTLNDLLGQGLQSNVVDAIGDILNVNVTSGGSYASLNDQLLKSVKGTKDTEGILERYSKTITTDSINQYSAQYHETIAADLGLNWGRYVGSNITTTREFCELLTKKEWVHRTELPEIVKGHIDGHSCKLNKQGLPLGMIPGTDANNFKIRRGGYNCGHQFFWVPDSAVPNDIKDEFENAGTKSLVTQRIKQTNKAALEGLKKRGVEFPVEVLKHMDPDITIINETQPGSFYKPADNSLTIGGGDRAKNEYYQKKIVYHEGGHAIHFNKKIITFNHVDPDFKKFYTGLQKEIKGHESEIDRLLWDKGYANANDTTLTEQIGILHDTLGGLTQGKYGAGHSLAYYQTGNFSLMEVFAHSMTLARIDNEFIDLHPALKKIAGLMKEYGLKILESE
jgi:hypothetical protein